MARFASRPRGLRDREYARTPRICIASQRQVCAHPSPPLIHWLHFMQIMTRQLWRLSSASLFIRKVVVCGSRIFACLFVCLFLRRVSRRPRSCALSHIARSAGHFAPHALGSETPPRAAQACDCPIRFTVHPGYGSSRIGPPATHPSARVALPPTERGIQNPIM